MTVKKLNRTVQAHSTSNAQAFVRRSDDSVIGLGTYYSAGWSTLSFAT
jgi:hypothetical protein